MTPVRSGEALWVSRRNYRDGLIVMLEYHAVKENRESRIRKRAAPSSVQSSQVRLRSGETHEVPDPRGARLACGSLGTGGLCHTRASCRSVPGSR